MGNGKARSYKILELVSNAPSGGQEGKKALAKLGQDLFEENVS